MLLDVKKQDLLRARFNPDGSMIRQHQLRMLEMLSYIDSVCRKNNIHYWLSSGTCLGAIRHGGFIPWDDDADIEMLREDYIRLKNAILDDKDHPYIWQDHSTDYGYLAPYAKLRDRHSIIKENTLNDKFYNHRGIYVDIFILEPSKSKFIRKVGDYFQIAMLFKLNNINNNRIRNLLINSNWWLLYKIIYPVLCKLDGSDKVGNTLRHCMGSMFNKPRSRDMILYQKRVMFEGIMLPVPEKFDDYLTQLYGDYRQLPALDSLTSHISNITFTE